MPGDGGEDAGCAVLVAALEHGSEDAFLPPDLAGGELAIRSQAGELCAGAGAAGGAVIFATGAEDKVAAMIRRLLRRAEQFNVVHFREASRVHRGADREGGAGKFGEIGEGEREPVVRGKKKPVAAPGDIARDCTGLYLAGFAVGRHIAEADPPFPMQPSGDHADGGLDAMLSRADKAEVMKGGDETDQAVAAHAEQPDIVEENHARCAGRVLRRDKQRPDDDLMATRFAKKGAPMGFEVLCGDAFEHHAGGLTAGVGVDDGDAKHGGASCSCEVHS